MQVWKLYEKKGEEISRKNKTCPKCGAGVYLAAHKDRLTCGKCHYMEKTSASKPEEKKPKKEEKPAKKEEPKKEEKKE
jgi:small subunit ribosomal protein S27Ae